MRMKALPAPTLSLDELRTAAERGEIDSVTIVTPDLAGKLMGKRVGVDRFLAGLPDSVEVSCSIFVYDNEQAVLEGFPEIGEQNGWADVAARPDLATLRRAAWVDHSATVMADLWWNAQRPVEISPRHVLRGQVDHAAAMGLEPWCSVELEFVLFAETYETARRRGYRRLRRPHDTASDYSAHRADRDEHLLGDLRRILTRSGLGIDSVKTELGPAQYEITLAATSALEAADAAALLKHATRVFAAGRDRSVSFMARLDHREAGNSGHVHISVRDPASATNLFDSEHGLSPLGRHFIGGVMHHAPDYMLLCCPYQNSYKRLDPENFVTAVLDYADAVRTTPLRVVGHGSNRNVEYRIPGADANPYLVLAAVIASGLDGIEHEREPFRPGSDAAAAVGDLPDTLPAAIERFTDSDWARRTFGDLVVDTLATRARHELAAHQREVSDVELRRGFEWA
jgi:glutamine synthetase